MEFDALAPVTGLARRASAPVESPVRSPLLQNPAEVLAVLMDFSGSVALAELLQVPAPDGPAHPDVQELSRKLQEYVRTKLDALLALSLRPLTGVRAPVIPLPEQLYESLALVAGGPGRVPDEQATRRLANDLGAPLHAAFGNSLRQAQAQLTGLRQEIAQHVRELGPRAERLERIDSALSRSIQRKQAELFERVELASDATFERACAHACAALPQDFGPDALVSWSGPNGWLGRYRDRCVHMTKALFVHLQRSIEGLLVAAVQAEVAR